MARAIYLSMLEWHFDRSSFWGLLSTHQDSQIQVSEGDREILRDQFFSNARRKIMLRRYSPRTFEDVTKSQDFTSLGLDAPPRNAEECLRDWEREDGQLSRDVADLVREHGSPQRHRARFVRRAYLSHAYKILCEEFGNKLFP